MWLIYTLLAIVFFTILSLLQRRIAVDTKYPRTAIFVFDCWALSLVLLLTAVNGGFKNFNITTNLAGYFWIGIACLSYGIFERLRFTISRAVEASVQTIIGNVATAVAFIIALFLYHETVTLQKLLGTLLIFLAILLLSWNIHKKVVLFGIGLAVLAEIALGIGYGLDKMGVMILNVDTYNILLWSIPLIVVFLPRIPKDEFVYELKNGGWKVGLMALANVLGYWFQLKALEIAEASRVIMLMQTISILVVMGGIFVLKEKDDIKKKLLAMLIGVAGAVLIV